MSERRYKFDKGDWVAVRNHVGDWRLAGKVVDADDESCCVENAHGLRTVYVVGEDPISRVRWTGQRKWVVV